MAVIYIKRVMAFIVLVFFQVLVFNHVHLFGYATPLLYIYILLKFNLGTSRIELLIWGFLLGLTVDIFSNTPGVSAAATTFYALLQPLLVRLFTPRDIDDTIEPGFKIMGVAPFLRFVIISVLIHQTVLFTIEFFSFVNWIDWLISILSSTLLTVFCIVAIEGIGMKKKTS